MASLDDMTVRITVTSNLITMDKSWETRDHRKVRILCVDGPGNLCVYGIVTTEGHDFINPMRWDINGRFSWIGYCPENDLIPVPTKSKHELAVTIGLSCLTSGTEPAKVLEDVYHEGQRSVTDDPQAWGLTGGKP